MKSRIVHSCAVVALSTYALIALPGTVRAEQTNDVASKGHVAEDFTKELKTKLRGILPGGAAVGTSAAVPETSSKISLHQVTFEFNSSNLTPEAIKILATVGETMSSEHYGTLNFIVEGHTDAKGSAAYNMALSKRRAEAVKQYLTTNYKIASARLRTVGKGKTELEDKAHPESAVNRRVAFVAN